LISIDNSKLDVRYWKLPSRTPSLKGATRFEVMTAEAGLFFVLLACPPFPLSIFRSSLFKRGMRGILISVDNSKLDVRNWKLPSRTPSLKGATHREVMTFLFLISYFLFLISCPSLSELFVQADGQAGLFDVFAFPHPDPKGCHPC
jgi:hypothetical protein